jgi:predicted permease
MVLPSLIPVFALIALGAGLKRAGLTDEAFLARSDRLVYYAFFPALLFWKIGGTAPRHDLDWHFPAAMLLAVLTVYGLSLIYIRWRVTDYQAGSFSQSCYRFNTYVGMAVVLNALGEEGVRLFGILIGLAIPFINVLAVSTLIWFSGRPVSGSERLRLTGRALVANPLILACVAGLIYSRLVGGFHPVAANTLGLMAAITLPLALLSIGGALTLESVRGFLPQSLAAAGFKLVVLPLAGLGYLHLMGVAGPAFKVGMIFCALPTSTAIYVLSSQLNSDTRLAAATIALSTMLSLMSLSVVLASL